jgi:4-amino-4-deoxy-L-arabinose transferase-like glycosyltransferase
MLKHYLTQFASLRNLLLVLSILITSFFCLYNLGQNSFGEGDQVTHSLVAQDMVHANTYFKPTVAGKPYFNKPPLKIWLVSLIVKVFGESNFNYRVLDGLIGICIAISIFLLAHKLFSNPYISFLSVLNLLGCRLFLFSHGVRVATQDSSQVLLYILALFPLLKFIEYCRNQSNSNTDSPIAKKALIKIGFFSGLGMLCKGLGALIIGPIMLASSILVPSPLKVLLNNLKYFILMGVCILAPLLTVAAFFGDRGDNFLRMLFITEGFKRATKGYHFVNHKWYYFNILFKHQMTVLPVLMLLGLAICLYQYFKHKKFQYGFLAIISIVPIIFYQLMKSKLEWYIYPAIPGLSILAGLTLFIFTSAAIRYCKSKSLLAIPLVLITLYFYQGVLKKVFSNYESIVTVYPEYPLDKLAHELEGKDNPPSVGIYKHRHFAKNDHFYLRMIDKNYLLTKDTISLDQIRDGANKDIMIAPLKDAPSITSIRKPKGYMLMPFYGRRRKASVLLWYRDDSNLPQSIKPWCTKLNLFNHRNKNMWAEKPGIIHGVKFIGTRGLYSNFFFKGDGLQAYYDSTVKIYQASTGEGANNLGNKVNISINDTSIITIAPPKEGFNYYSGRLQSGLLQKGMNLFSVRHEPGYSQHKFNSHSELSFISEAEICPE